MRKPKGVLEALSPISDKARDYPSDPKNFKYNIREQAICWNGNCQTYKEEKEYYREFAILAILIYPRAASWYLCDNNRYTLYLIDKRQYGKFPGYTLLWDELFQSNNRAYGRYCYQQKLSLKEINDKLIQQRYLKKDCPIYNAAKVRYSIKERYTLNELTAQLSGYYAYFAIFITIREYTVPALIDTGAAASFILSDFAKRIKIPLRVKEQKYKLGSAIGAITGIIYETVLIRISF